MSKLGGFVEPKQEDHITKVFRQLLDRGLSGKQLWDVLTALRGPDDGNYDVKDATTSVIRYTLGFRQSNTLIGVSSDHQGYFNSNPDEERFVETRKAVNIAFSHFGG